MINLKTFLEESTLQYHKKLNTALWLKTEDLRPEIRKKLLQFADAWADFAGIHKGAIVDVVMSGGNANYNYTPTSDIDIHIVIDKTKFKYPEDFMDDYFWDKKMLWTMTHDIKIKGYPLEPYAQDKNEKYPKDQGVYSLKNDKWIQKPTFKDLDFEHNETVKNKVEHYKRIIDHLIQHKMGDSAYNKIKNKLSAMRSAGISKNGEFANENLIFKELRNLGYLDKMNNYIKTKQDRKLSLK